MKAYTKFIFFIFIAGIFLCAGQVFSDNGKHRLISINGKNESIKATILTGNINVSRLKILPVEYYWYLNNEIHSTFQGASAKLLDGLYETYYLNSSLKESGNFKEGKKNGIFKFWSSTGILLRTGNFKNGKKVGLFVDFDEKGKIVQRAQYKNNLLSGKFEIFHNDSIFTRFYKNGKEINLTKIESGKGKKKLEGSMFADTIKTIISTLPATNNSTDSTKTSQVKVKKKSEFKVNNGSNNSDSTIIKRDNRRNNSIPDSRKKVIN